MTDISATLVKELRDATGVGMMAAKKALVTCDGDIKAATNHLRESGALKAAKKAARATSEGRVAAFVEGDTAALAAVCCETDFVAKNDQFRTFIDQVAESIAKAGTSENPDQVNFVGGGSIGEALTGQISTTGENLNLGKMACMKEPEGFFGIYIHNNGKIGVLTQIKGSPDDAGQTMAKQIAMHVAASAPIALRREEVPADLIDEEKQLYRRQAEAEGKPEKIIDKIVEGKLNAFFKERVLLEQPFVMEPKKKVKDVIKEAGDFELAAFSMVTVG